MRIRSLAACMAVAAATVGASAASAQAATTTFDLPVSGTVPNDCTGEMVAIDGTSHNKVTDNSSLSGIKYQIEGNLTGVKGTGVLSGARYVMNDQTSDMSHAEFDALGNVQQTMEESTILTRQGESGALVMGDDFRLHVLVHLTVSNGVMRADGYDLRADCR
jgi:hypothetical protein